MQICFPCANCNLMLVAAEDTENRQVFCPACGLLVALPDVQQAVPAVPAPAAVVGEQPDLLPEAENLVLRQEIKVVGEAAALLESDNLDDEEQPILEVELEEIKDDEPLVKPTEVVKIGLQAPPPEDLPLLELISEEHDEVEVLVSEELDPAPPVKVEEPVTLEFLPEEKVSFDLSGPVRVSPFEPDPPRGDLSSSDSAPHQGGDTGKMLEIEDRPLKFARDAEGTASPELTTTAEVLAVGAPGPEQAVTLQPGVVREPVLAGLGFDLLEPEKDVPFKLQEDKPVLVEKEINLYQQRRKKKSQEKLREERRRLKTANIGLTLIYWGTISFLLALLLIIVGILGLTIVGSASLIDAISGAGAAGTAVVQTAGLFALALVISFALQFGSALLIWVGKLFCCWVPKESKARTLILISFALDAPALGLAAMSFVTLTFAPLLLAPGILETALTLGVMAQFASLLLMLVSFVLFFLFLHAFADYLDQPGIAGEALSIMKMWLFLSMGFPLIFVLFLLGSMDAVVMGLLILFAVGAGFWWCYLYVAQWIRLLHLTGSLREVLSSQYRL